MSKLFLSRYSLLSDLELYTERTVHYETERVEQHEHDFYELVIVQKGSAVHVVDGYSFKITTGHVFLVSPGHQHYYKNIEHLTILNILFNPVILELFRNDLLNIPGFQMLFSSLLDKPQAKHRQESVEVDEGILSEIMLIFNKILGEQTKREPGANTSSLTSFIQLILLISRQCHPSNGKHYSHAHQISKVINYMENNYSQKLTLKLLSEVSGLSGSSFRRCFYDAVGFSPINYLLKLRLKKAALLLDTSDLSITEIAYKTGFSDSNYFIRQFKKFTGTTPLKYRAGDHGIFYIPTH
jgi:AraC-like DNA-binding protein